MIKIILWPFTLVWSFVGLIFKLLGCMLSAILGFVFIIIGAVLTITIVGAIVGIPMIISGTMLIIHSIFG